MGFKSEQKNLTFSDLEQFIERKNKSLDTLMDLEKAVSWDRIKSILMKDYPVDQKKVGNKAYSPLFLFKCLLLQKWFKINSDPELKTSSMTDILSKLFWDCQQGKCLQIIQLFRYSGKGLQKTSSN